MYEKGKRGRNTYRRRRRNYKMGIEEYTPLIIMIGLQFVYASHTILTRAALLEEMSSTVLVVYRQCFGFFLMAPLAFFSRKGSSSGCLNWKSFWMIFLLSLLGMTANLNANYMAMSLISSSVTSAMYNLAPGITFALAYTLGLEKVDLRSLGSLATIIGTAVCVGGAAALALLKGPKLLNKEANTNYYESPVIQESQTWLIGCLLALAGSIFWSLSLILQVNTNKIYPDPISLTTWMCLMASFQSGIFALLLEPNLNAWKLTSPLSIFVCFYSGIVSAVGVLGQTWCISKRGPLFSAMFQPLCTLIITLLGCLFLHEDLYLGSLIGGAAVVIGLYIVLWGKGKDYKEVKEEIPKVVCTSQVSNNCIIDLKEPFCSK